MNQVYELNSRFINFYTSITVNFSYIRIKGIYLSNQHIKIILSLVIFYILVLSTDSFSQIRGVTGITVMPRIVNVMDLPNMGEIEMGPMFESRFNEVDPPPFTIHPVPNAEDLPHFTLDKNAHNFVFDAPTSGTNFEGMTQTTAIPSEPQPAVGPNHIVILGNVSIKITDKTGTVITNTTQSTFFGIPVAEGSGFDSKGFYDARYGRFVLLAESKTSSLNYYYLAISQTNSAAGSWYIYKLDMTLNGVTPTTNWSDFPGLGISSDKIALSGQQYTFSANSYQYQKLRILDRSVAYSGGPVTYVDFFNWSGQRFCTKPGRNISVSDTIHLLATPNGGGTNYYYRRVTGTPSSPVMSGESLIPVSSFSIPPDAPGGSASITVPTGDARTSDFFVRNGILYSAIHGGVNIGGGGTETVIKYVRIQVSPLSTTALTDETFGATDVFYYYPMVCVDSVGTMFMGYGRSSTTEFPSSYITGKRRNDATIQASVLAKAGTVVNVQSRWGDYTGIDMDESASSNTVSYSWYSGQYTKASNVFGVWATQMSYTYGKITGQVLTDSDGDVSTTGDRSAISGATVTLKQGASTLASTTSDGSGNYTFGYLETATNYSVEFTAPSGRYSVDVIPGSGGTSQSKSSYKSIAVNLTDAQTSTGNNYIVSDWHTSIATGNWNASSTWSDAVTPGNTEKVFISTANTVTINTDIICSGFTEKGVIQFDNVTTRSLTINGQMVFSNGTITLGNNNVILGSGATISGASSTNYFVTDGTGTLTRNSVGASNNVFPIGPSASYNPVTINNSGTADNFSVRVQNTISPSPTDPSKVVNRMWTITEAVAGFSNATVTLQYNTGEWAGSFNNSSGATTVGRHNGTIWTETSATWSNPSANVFTAAAGGFTAFSPFAISNSGALPVNITYFNSAVTKRDVTLNWGTTGEINNSGFDIERAQINKDGTFSWFKTAFVSGSGTTNEEKNYTYEDKKLASGNYKYRIKQIDYNGSFEYFNLASDVSIGTPNVFSVSQNYPNPSNPKSKIDYEIPALGKVTLKIYDITGREIAVLVNETKDAGYYTAEFDGSGLASGIYFYRITGGENFTMVKKMVLVK